MNILPINRFAIAVAVALLSPSLSLAQTSNLARPESVGMSSEGLRRLASAMQVHIDSGRVAGMVMVISRKGELVYEEALGNADIDTRAPMRSDAVFVLASARKPLMAAATMRLVEAGKLKLDDPVAKYIPAFGNVAVYESGGAASPSTSSPSTPVTIRHLLTHTSGLATGYFAHPTDSIYNRIIRGSNFSLEEFANTLAAIPIEFSPGTAWRYSRTFEVIGRVLEVVSGQTLDKFIEEQLAVPLGLTATMFRSNDRIADRIPTRYASGPNRKLKAIQGLGRSDGLPTGTMISTPRDYIRFGNMLLDDGVIEGRRYLSSASVKELMRNQLPVELTPISTPLWDHKGYGFGLGGAVKIDMGIEGESAAAGTYRWPGSSGVFFWVDPVNDLVAAVFTQSNPGYWFEHEFERRVYQAIAR